MNLKNTLLATLIFFSSTIAKAQRGASREFPPFTAIEIGSIDKLYIRQDSVQSVRMDSDDRLDEVGVEVKDNTLIIHGKPGAELYVTVPHLEKISIEGNGDVISRSTLTGDKLVIAISGNGSLNADIKVNTVKASVSGVGKVVLSGTAENAELAISGSGKIDAFNLQVANCTADISGVGKCTIDVTESLTSNISGSGSVTYKTKPKHVAENISGVGKVGVISGYNSSLTDTTKLNMGNNTEIWIINQQDTIHRAKKNKPKPIWAGFEMGLNNYFNADGSIGPPAGYGDFDLRQENSVSVGLNVVQTNVELGHSNVWFFTGLGITWNNYHFSDNVMLHSTDPVTTTRDTSNERDYIKSKLTASYLMAPVMFEVFTSRNKKKAFHFGAGGMLGLRLGSHTKQKIEEDGEISKPKTFDDYNLNAFRYGVRVATGYGKLNLFAEYYFSPLFREGKGPTLYPATAGITLVGF